MDQKQPTSWNQWNKRGDKMSDDNRVTYRYSMVEISMEKLGYEIVELWPELDINKHNHQSLSLSQDYDYTVHIHANHNNANVYFSIYKPNTVQFYLNHLASVFYSLVGI